MRRHNNVTELLAHISHALVKLYEQGEKIMATLQDVQTQVTAEDTVIDSAVALLQGLAQQVKDLQPNQAAIDALAADITAKTQVLADAVVANTPAAPGSARGQAKPVR